MKKFIFFLLLLPLLFPLQAKAADGGVIEGELINSIVLKDGRVFYQYRVATPDEGWGTYDDIGAVCPKGSKSPDDAGCRVLQPEGTAFAFSLVRVTVTVIAAIAVAKIIIAVTSGHSVTAATASPAGGGSGGGAPPPPGGGGI